MATGSGKTIVMAMIAAWSVLNRVRNRQDTRFSDAVLILCPNLTIRERLQVLLPSRPDNYYQAFEIVPGSLMEDMHRGKFMITNWHALAEDRDPKRGVVHRGPESDEAFARRVLGRDLGSKSRLLVMNDEAHHAYREAPVTEETQLELADLNATDKKQVEEEKEAARVWVQGLDKIARARGINFCLDVSATPFYIQGSGNALGTPLPWVVSDFGLVDAIECGIVKIPRVPIDDDSGAPEPKYFRLWDTIMAALPAGERAGPRRRAKPDAVWRHAEPAAVTLAGEWHEEYDACAQAGNAVPPVMIVVCDNTDLAKEVHETIVRSGLSFAELKNTDTRESTIRIDSKLLAAAEARDEGQTKQDAAELLREKVATVGKIGKPGEQIRCVVSVSMLTEGWDAQNVTQILGIRPFRSQLLCEQVVGRGLRRTNYDDLTVPEYCDVYGIPFEVIPVKKSSSRAGAQPKPSFLIQALKERVQYEITFPRVEGYVFDVKERIRANIDAQPELIIDPSKEPTSVVVVGAGVGYRVGRPDRGASLAKEFQDRNPFYTNQRLQATVFDIARRVTDTLCAGGTPAKRAILFPQVTDLAWQYIERRVRFRDVPEEEVGLKLYMDTIVARLFNAIEPDTTAGEAPLLPRIERYRPVGSTREVMFRSVRNLRETVKSHVSHVVLDSSWESSVAYRFEYLAFVTSYVRNDHLDFTIPYEFQGISHDFIPDYIVHIVRADATPLSVVVETKGRETEQDRAKASALDRWVRAVNHHGGFGTWASVWARDPATISSEVQKLR